MNTAKRTLLSAAIAALAFSAMAQERVTLKGQVIPLGPTQGTIMLILLVDGQQRAMALGRHGNFRLEFKEGQTVLMTSHCPGFEPKRVMIDTKNANGGIVRFDVELHAQEGIALASAPALAGSIAFASGTGRLLVEHWPDPAPPFRDALSANTP